MNFTNEQHSEKFVHKGLSLAIYLNLFYTTEQTLHKNGKNDQETHIFHFHKMWNKIPWKYKTGDIFSILNPQPH